MLGQVKRTVLGWGCVALALCLLAGTARAQWYPAGSSNSTLQPYFYGVPTAPTFMTSINYPLIYGAYEHWYSPSLFTTGAMQTPYQIAPQVPMGYPSLTPATPTWVQYSANRRHFAPAPVEVPRYLMTHTQDYQSQPATIAIRVPDTATVEIQGRPFAQAGTERQFVTPALDAFRSYYYDIRATWREDGREVTDTQRVTVRAGDTEIVSFGAYGNVGQTRTLRASALR